MKENEFLDYKNTLLSSLKSFVSKHQLKEEELQDILLIEMILKDYSYENRLKMKGRLSRLAIDSLTLDMSFLDVLIAFDQEIT